MSDEQWEISNVRCLSCLGHEKMFLAEDFDHDVCPHCGEAVE